MESQLNDKTCTGIFIGCCGNVKTLGKRIFVLILMCSESVWTYQGSLKCLEHVLSFAVGIWIIKLKVSFIIF